MTAPSDRSDATRETGPTHLLAPVLARAEAPDTAYRIAIRQWSRRRTRGTRVREEVTYRDLAARIEATARGLAADGLAPGDRALFSVRPRATGVVLALGVVRAGGTVVFVDPGSTPGLFAARVAAARPTLAITEALLYAVSRGPLRRLARSRGLLLPDYASLPVRHVYAGRRLPGVPRGARSARSLATHPSGPLADHALIDLDADAATRPGLVVFTSGTTAAPKAVVHTPASLHAGCDLLRGVFELQPGDIVHTDQMLLGMPALLAGATWSVPADPPARDIVGFAGPLPDAAATYLVPADVTRLLDAIEAGRVPARGPRLALVGGAPVTRALLARAMRVLPGTRWVAAYGMTEILPIAVVDAHDKLGYAGDGDLVGTPLPGVRVSLAFDAGNASDAGPAVGELVVGGPSLMAGYLHDLDTGRPPVTAQHTGDLARLDEQGRIVLVGRARDMIIRGTTNIYPGLFEPRIAGLPGVLDAVMVGVPRDNGDEVVVLVVTTTPREAGSAPAGVALDSDHPLVAHVRAALPGIVDHDALPDVVLHASGLPLAGRSGKPDRAALAHAAAPWCREVARHTDPTARQGD